jgi:tetratricopeptide (TPR) repeat protein
MNDWTKAEKRVQRAHKLYEEGRWVEAAAELRAAIGVNPYNPAWYFNLAVTLEAMEDFPHACEAYGEAVRLDPRDVEALNCLAVNLTRLGRYRESLDIFERAHKLDPMHEPTYCNRISTYSEMGDHDNAELMFYMARQIKAECPQCQYFIGGSLYARGLYARAIRCWEEARRLDPKHPDANTRIAEAYWAMGDLKRARERYLEEVRRFADDVDLLLDFGDLLAEMDLPTEARAQFRRALDITPDHAGAHFAIGELAMKRGELPEAEEMFRVVLQLDEKFPGACLRLGQVLLRKGRPEEAVKYLLKEVPRCTDDPDAMMELGGMLLEAGQATHANLVLGKLARLRPDDATVQHDLAVSFLMLGRYEDGMRHCRKALKIRPDYASAFYNLALAYMEKGRSERARRYASRALLADPQSDSIRRLARHLGAGSLWFRIRSRLSRLTPGAKKS